LFVAAGRNGRQPAIGIGGAIPGRDLHPVLRRQLLDFVPLPKDEVTNCAFGGRI